MFFNMNNKSQVTVLGAPLPEYPLKPNGHNIPKFLAAVDSFRLAFPNAEAFTIASRIPVDVFEVIVMVESLNSTSISSFPPKAADGGGQSDDDSSVSSGDSVSNILGDRSTEIRQRLNTDEGITEYFIREYGPKSVAASTKLLQSVKMASSADCSSFSAAVQFVSDFTASLKWCRAFLPKKKIRMRSFLEGIFPVALREALILNGYFSMSGVIRDFLQAYKEAVNSSVLLRS